jgi:hypothetical protein
MADLVSNITVILGVLRNTKKLYDLSIDAYRGDKEVQCLVEEIEAVEQSVTTVRELLVDCVGLQDTTGTEISAVTRLRETLNATQSKSEQARTLLEKKLLKAEKSSAEDEPNLRNKLSVGRRVSKIKKLCQDLIVVREELGRSLQLLDS